MLNPSSSKESGIFLGACMPRCLRPCVESLAPANTRGGPSIERMGGRYSAVNRSIRTLNQSGGSGVDKLRGWALADRPRQAQSAGTCRYAREEMPSLVGFRACRLPTPRHARSRPSLPWASEAPKYIPWIGKHSRRSEHLHPKPQIDQTAAAPVDPRALRSTSNVKFNRPRLF